MRSYNDDLTMSFAIGCWVRDTVIVESQKNVEYSKSFLSAISTAKTSISTTIPGMQGHKMTKETEPPAPLESYCFESFRLRLAIKTWWLPDFMVVTSDGLIEFHEVKGIWQDAARIKIKTAAELYPQFLFIAITKEPKKRGGGWKREVFRSSMQVD
jgi:hypothetical protein